MFAAKVFVVSVYLFIEYRIEIDIPENLDGIRSESCIVFNKAGYDTGGRKKSNLQETSTTLLYISTMFFLGKFLLLSRKNRNIILFFIFFFPNIITIIIIIIGQGRWQRQLAWALAATFFVPTPAQ